MRRKLLNFGDSASLVLLACSCLLWLGPSAAIGAQEPNEQFLGDSGLAIQGTAQISGTVRDAETGLPLAGEPVTVRGSTTPFGSSQPG